MSHTPGPIPSTLADYACIDYVNSRFTDHTGTGAVYDRLEMAAWRDWFTSRWDIPTPGSPTRREVLDLRALRILLRRMLTAPAVPATADVARLNRFLHRSVRIPELVRARRSLQVRQRWSAGGWAVVIAAVADSYVRLVQMGDAGKVRVCRNPHCSWLFHDASESGRRRWCDTAVCGNLMRVQRHRTRARAREAG